MERASDLMRKLGFREDASEELKKAFIRNLVRAAFPGDIAKIRELERAPTGKSEEQLEFQFDPMDSAG